MNAQAQLLKQHSNYIFKHIEGARSRTCRRAKRLGIHARAPTTSGGYSPTWRESGASSFPQILQGTVKLEGWDDDYDEQTHALKELIDDLGKAHEVISGSLDETDDAELGKPLTLWGMDADKKNLLFHLMAELIHHNGQIAMLRGIYRDARSNDAHETAT